MQIGRFGTLIGFGVQVIGAGMLVIAPNANWIGWVLIGVGGLVLVAASTVWVRANYKLRVPWITKSHAQDCTPLIEAQSIAVGKEINRLYVGQMGISDTLDEHAMEIWIRCYNATGSTIWVTGISGWVEFTFIGGLKDPVRLPVPAIQNNDRERVNIPDATEFVVILDQRISREIAEYIVGLDGQAKAGFTFTNLDVTVSPIGSDHAAGARMPLWDGINLQKSSRALDASRVVHLIGRSTL